VRLIFEVTSQLASVGERLPEKAVRGQT